MVSAMSTPSTPPRCEVLEAASPLRDGKRRRLQRQFSDEKENPPKRRQITKTSLTDVSLKPRAPLQPLQTQNQDRPLVGREQECGELDRFLDQSLGNGAGNGRCLYISGGPGTGKTCSVRASINKYRRNVSPDTCVIEVNCMDLAQRSVSAVLHKLLLKMNRTRPAGMSMQGLAALTASNLAEMSKRVVIVVDEVDQLISRSASKAAAGALSLETLFSLPRLPGAPAVAIVAIANAVDLLERSSCFSSSLNCRTLLFEPYSKDQLKNIVTNRLKGVEGGDEALKALGGIKVQMRVTQVAKESGDCRQVMSLIEEALSEAKSITEAARLPAATLTTSALPLAESSAATSTDLERDAALLPKRDPRTLIQSNRNDPLQAIHLLPLEQQILLATLATSKNEATKLSDVCKRYKELCKDLKQAETLGSKGQVTCALSALEHRGLLAMRSHRGAAGGRGKKFSMPTETTVELWVACDQLLESVLKAKPELTKFVKMS